jgi:ribosomal protein L7/L12
MNDFEQRVRDLMAARNKPEAIRLVREATGLGLAEAKAALEQWESGGKLPPPKTGQTDKSAPGGVAISDLPPEVTALARQGKTIEAIKLLREQRSLGLKEAKDLVDQVPLDPGAKRSGCAALVLAAVGLGGALLHS